MQRVHWGISGRSTALNCMKLAAPLAACAFVAMISISLAEDTPTQPAQNMSDKITKTDAEWKQQLTPAQYHVLREKGTERAGSGEYAANHDKGIYKCAACAKELFSSETKFESGTGWPSFYQPIAKEAVTEETDRKFFMKRTEVLCSRCGGHLGHVFDDGPEPTGLRYCMNSVAMKFEKTK